MIKKIIKKKSLLFFLLSLFLILPSILPLFRPDFFRMHDYIHVARLVELNTALRHGQIPPRWAPDFGWGLGMPLFHFYAPLPYYIAQIFYFLGTSAVWSIKLVFMLNFIAGFYFVYLWAKQFWGKLGGLLAAASFVYLPYRAVQFYVRGSLSELTAMTFIPLFFYAVQKKNTILIALAITGIFLSHNVIALFALFFLSFYFLFHLKSWKKFLASGLLSFGLSAFFLLPAFFEKQYTSVDSIVTAGYSSYLHHFIYLRQLFDRKWGYGGSILGPFDNISFQLGYPQIILAALASIVFIKIFRKNKNKKKFLSELTYLAIAFLISVFMMTFHSQFIWTKFKIIQLAQFPWRLLAFTSTFTAFLTGSITYLIKDRQKIKTIVSFLILITIGLNYQFFKPSEYSPNEDFYYTDKQKIKAQMSDTLYDYLPINAKKPPKVPDKQYQTLADITDFNSKTGYFSFTSNTSKTEDFILNQYFFPGWQVKINNQLVDIKPDEQLGRIQFQLPSGEHQVKIKLAKTKLQYWSDIISLISWTGLIGFLLLRKKINYDRIKF